MLPYFKGLPSEGAPLQAAEITIINLHSCQSLMSNQLQLVYLARHAETEWSLSGQHTGLTDLPLTTKGESDAAKLGERLQELSFANVFTSPLQRAARTCEISGLKSKAIIDSDLVEWDYGAYEGLTSKQIRESNPTWQLFRDGCPEGETVEQASARAERMLQRIRSCKGDVLLFTSGHFARVLALRWLGCQLHPLGSALFLGTASLSILGYDRSPEHPVLRLWNETRHLES